MFRVLTIRKIFSPLRQRCLDNNNSMRQTMWRDIIDLRKLFKMHLYFGCAASAPAPAKTPEPNTFVQRTHNRHGYGKLNVSHTTIPIAHQFSTMEIFTELSVDPGELMFCRNSRTEEKRHWRKTKMRNVNELEQETARASGKWVLNIDIGHGHKFDSTK